MRSEGNSHVNVLLESRAIEVGREVAHHQFTMVDVRWDQAKFSREERIRLVAPALDTGRGDQRDPAL